MENPMLMKKIEHLVQNLVDHRKVFIPFS